MRILAISGSLRKGSYNSALLRAVMGEAPEGVEVILAPSLDRLPFFNPDLDDPASPRAAVGEWREALEAADALLIASPEYAHAMSGVLKNALDWVVGSGELVGKPVAVLNASPTHLGADKAHASLKYTIALLSANLVEEASMRVDAVNKKIDVQGRVTDTETLRLLRCSLNQLIKAAGWRQVEEEVPGNQ